VAEHFVHVAEEPPINPSYVFNLAGCGLRCRFCQQGALLDPDRVRGHPLGAALWPTMDLQGARSLSFVGGNPDESLYAILRFLETAPGDLALPVVWNSHGYGTAEGLALLDGVVDAYVPDFKYAGERCARRLSGAPGYPAVVRTTIAGMLRQGVPVIVRILVLPGHGECCHLPSLRALAEHASSAPGGVLLVSVRGQYAPDWKITRRDGVLARRVRPGEVAMVRGAAHEVGLALVEW
jgi:putative pyruvate formate lyase activating enzyme